MKIISWNVNGLRAVYKKNFKKWLAKTNPDIICLQEAKLQKEQLPDDLLNPKKHYVYFNFAEKKGYSGVIIYTKEKPLKIKYKLGIKRFDKEGRILQLEYPEFILINLYIPHGGRQKENLDYKLDVYRRFLKHIKKLKNKNIILVGDFNVAHKEIDLSRPKQNQKNIMFTPKERRQIDKIIELGFMDTFRKFNKMGGNYTWWPWLANARQRNLGWRIDYIFTSNKMTAKLKSAFIFSKIKGSDHCPIGIEIY